MNKVAIALCTKGKTELTRQVLPALLQPDKFDLHWFDGSVEASEQDFPCEFGTSNFELHDNVRGGPDAAVACALTTMLERGYTHVGLCESDILINPDWFGPTMALFDRGRDEGLTVGAVSARAYEDRILIQRDGYAVMHNLGWGTQIMTSEAATLALIYMRTGGTLENRRLFAQLAGVDIGRYWAFHMGDHMTCADWQNDRILAAHGLASLALVPSPVEMIGQNPPLAEQGLKIASKPFELLRDDKAFELYRDYTGEIRGGFLKFPSSFPYIDDSGAHTWFAHQVQGIGAVYKGDWRLHWHQGFGPFAWKSALPTAERLRGPSVDIPISGPCQILVSGGAQGGQIEIVDELSGFEHSPVLPPEGSNRTITSFVTPRSIGYGPIRLTALSPGVLFYGIRTQEPQPVDTSFRFDHHSLPPV